MIKVAGSAKRAFTFPADLATTFAYYSDLSYILNFLPRIYVTRTFGKDRFRVCYSSTELATYNINIFCNLESSLNAEIPALYLRPFSGAPGGKNKAGMRSASADGYFASESLFFSAGDETEIQYSIKLRATLPTPFGLKMMPGKVVDSIASNITNRRISEIAEGFIERSIIAFPDWVGELGQK